MRYPVSATGSKEEFDKYWYVAQGFGNQTSYGFHEGADINLRTGGDTDLNQELKAIANGQVVYYHYSSHPTSGYGRHLVTKIDGPWGTRWAHYAHCTRTDFTNRVQKVNEGQIIARLGKSGTPYAHVDFSIYKVDPATIGGLDKIARTSAALHTYWEDPIAFINTWIGQTTPPDCPPMDDQTTYDFGEPWGEMEMQAVRSTMNDQKKEIERLNVKIENAKNALQ